jgi:hypothetical protein
MLRALDEAQASVRDAHLALLETRDNQLTPDEQVAWFDAAEEMGR